MKQESLMRGISAPLLTPFRPDGRVDRAGCTRLAEYVTGAGVHGVFIGGTTGEFVNLTVRERTEVLEAARKGVKSGVRVLFNITAMNLEEMSFLADRARENGVDAVSVTAPYYHRYDAGALADYFCRAAEVAAELPLYLYNIPGMTGNPIPPAVLGEVVRRCPNVRGIKDSSMDFMTLLEYQCAVEKPGFELLTGNDAQVLTALQSGAAGGVVAMASVFPGLCRGIWDRFWDGDLEGARAAQRTVLKLRDLVRRVMPVMGHKAMMEELGLPMGPARFPMRELTGAERRAVHAGLEELGLLRERKEEGK